MKIRMQIAKLYMAEHGVLFAGALVPCIVLGGCLSLLERNGDYFYLGMLYLFLFLMGAGIHFFKSVPLYRSILSPVEGEEDIFLDGNSPFARVQRAYLKKICSVYAGQLEELQQQNQNYKLVMNKWVHQMKTPLSVLHMMTQDQSVIPSERIEEEIKRMDDLLNQILQLIRMENLKNDFMVQRCKLSEIVRSAVNEQKSYFIQNEIYPKVKMDSSVFVYTDPKWLSFAVGQFLTNAVKYSEPKKAVEIFLERREQWAVLKIQDFGIGILSEDLPRIFEFCYTGSNGRKKQKESSGLGLYLAKQILDYLGHRVETVSVPGEGTVFTIYMNTDRER